MKQLKNGASPWFWGVPEGQGGPFLNASEYHWRNHLKGGINMPSHTRKRLEPVKLPIVDADFVVKVFNDPNTKKSLVGVRRLTVEKVTQILLEAKRNQIDGFIELDKKDLGLILQAMASVIEWQGDLLFFRLENDDE